MMWRKFFIFLLLCLPVQAATRITATVTVTNSPTTNGMTIVVNSSTRTWTNNVVTASSQILTNNSIGGITTNLWQHIVANPFSGGVIPSWLATNQISLLGNIGQAMSVSFSGPWASVSYSTQTVTSMYTVRVPISGEQNSVATNNATLLLQGINAYDLIPIQLPVGSASAPAYSFQGDTNSGLFSPDSDTLAWAVGGAEKMRLNSSGKIGIGTNLPQYDLHVTAATPVIAADNGTNSVYLSANSSFGYIGSAKPLYIALGSAAAPALTHSFDTNGNFGLNQNGPNSRLTVSGGLYVGTGNKALTSGNAEISGNLQVGTSINGVLGSVTNGTAYGLIVTNGTYYGTVGLLSGGYLTSGLSGNSASNQNHYASIRFPRNNITSLANSNNAAIVFTNIFNKITNGPSAAFNLCGIAGGADGRWLIVLNRTGQAMYIDNESGAESVATNRILTLTGASVNTTGDGAATFIYDTEQARWNLISLQQ